MARIRRLSQLFFLVLFFVLFFTAGIRTESAKGYDVFVRFSPLSALMLFIAGSFAAKMLLSVVLVLLTILLGRVFCGWICPLGTLIDGAATLRRKKENPLSEKWKGFKYFLLVAIACAAIAGVQWVGLFDPLVLLWRSATIVVYPLGSLGTFALFDLMTKIPFLEEPAFLIFDLAQRSVLPLEQPHFIHSGLILLLFIFILAMSVFYRRFWCTALCPLGALLGLFSRFRILQHKITDDCTRCQFCVSSCRMQAIDYDMNTRNMDCIECGECIDACPEKALKYSVGKAGKQGTDLSRRRLLQATITGIVGASTVKALNPGVAKAASIIRPPGAQDEQKFLDACLRCQACVKVCDAAGRCLQPALLEAGWEGLWTPVVVPNMGYCEYNCTLCGQVCPSGAIKELTLAAKQKFVIGRAVIDKNVCIPWAENRNCLVCEEHCPLPQKAIVFEEHLVKDESNRVQRVKLPQVKTDLCIGCGICEYKCPVSGRPGVYILPPQVKSRVI